MDAGCYHGVRALAETHLEPRGVELRLAPPAELAEAARGADLLWLESPSNPELEVYDLAALAGLGVHDRGGQHHGRARCSSARSTSGATYALTSATKQMSRPRRPDARLRDHARRRARAGAARPGARYAGAIPGPFEVWLAHRSLPTLALRLERGCDNALAIARLLAARDDVERVRYPGLPDGSRPRGGPAPDARLRNGRLVRRSAATERAERFLAAAQLVTDATSFGSVHTTAERRARWGGDAVPEGFIRLSAGSEDTADLLADVERALNA